MTHNQKLNQNHKETVAQLKAQGYVQLYDNLYQNESGDTQQIARQLGDSTWYTKSVQIVQDGVMSYVVKG